MVRLLSHPVEQVFEEVKDFLEKVADRVNETAAVVATVTQLFRLRQLVDAARFGTGVVGGRLLCHNPAAEAAVGKWQCFMTGNPGITVWTIYTGGITVLFACRGICSHRLCVRMVQRIDRHVCYDSIFVKTPRGFQ